MSKILKILRKVNDSVNDLPVKLAKKYTEPKIFTGKGVDVKKWNKLTKTEQEKALSVDWFVYYSYRREDGKLRPMNQIKGGANRFKTKDERLQVLEELRIVLSDALKNGFNPLRPEAFIDDDPEILSVKDAFARALKQKEVTLSETSYNNFEGRITRFLKWLKAHGYEHRFITSITMRTVNKYLNEVLEQSSAANRNNTRLDISSVFTFLASEELIPFNFIKSIPVLHSSPERNKSYNTRQEGALFDFMAAKDPLLLLFVKFVSYGFLRPVEVCRLTVADVDVVDKVLKVRTKTDAGKTKIIPQILLDDLPDLSGYNATDFLFTPTGPGKWTAKESDRRGYFGKRFTKIKKALAERKKDPVELGPEYNMYSFRHTFATKLYRELIKTRTPDEAESYLMAITGHKTREALRKYLRDIDAFLPEDFSHMLR